MPILTLMPLLSAGMFYLFFQSLYTLLGFAANVIDAMLNENITIVLISSTVLGGQIILTTIVVYTNIRRQVDNHEDEDIEAENIHDDIRNDAGQNEEVAEDETQDEDEDMGMGMGEDMGEDETEAEGQEKKDTGSSCENCDDDCINCMPALIRTDISGDVIPMTSAPLQPISSVIASMPLTIDYMNLWSNNTDNVSI